MDFFIKETNVRAGNRGGKNLFNWNDVRLLSSRDRQSYLGSTQALGLMDRGGKWYKRDWWTHYNNQVNVYGHKDKLNNRSTLLEEQKEIRKKEKEKLYEFLYGKKKKNNINMNMNDNLSLKDENNKIDIGKSINNTPKTEYNDMDRLDLFLKNSGNEKNKKEDDIKLERKDKRVEMFLGKKTKNIDNDKNKKILDKDDNKSSKKHSHHHHHHYHHRHHFNKDKGIKKNE